MVADLEPDILQSKVKWALESMANNKASEGDGTPVKLFKILKDDTVKVQLHSFQTLARLCSKSYEVGFSSIWTENSQKYKLDSEEAEELETKLLTCVGLWRKPESSRKIFYFCSIDYAKAFDCVDHRKLWQILK